MKAAVLATGPSMSAALAESLCDYDVYVVVNDAFRLAPCADALVAQDFAWWNEYRGETDRFLGRKFSCNKGIPGVELVDYAGGPSTNSGALGIYVAATVFGGMEIDLYGFDMHGDHYFGAHPVRLKGTSERRRLAMQEQFFALKQRLDAMGVHVVNRTAGSALRAFPP
jgi:hypothetical protein